MELNEGLRKIFLAGVGAVATTAEAAKDVVDTLVKKGELTVEQGKVLNEELKQSAKEKVKEHVSVTVVKEYKDAMAAVEHMSADELEALKAKIADAEAAQAEKVNEDEACDTTETTEGASEQECCSEEDDCKDEGGGMPSEEKTDDSSEG